MTLLPGMAPTLTVTENGVTTNASFGTIADGLTTDNGQSVATTGAASFWNYAARDASGRTAIQFNVGGLLANAGADFVLTGSASGTTGSVTFFAKVLDKYTDANSGNSLREHDSTSNSVTGSGSVTSHATAQTAVQTDSSSVSDTVATGGLVLSITKVNGAAPGSTVNIQAGDLVTYQLEYDLTTGDYGALNLNAFLPLPVYGVPGALASGNGTDVNTFSVISNPSGGTPSATTDSTANSIKFDFGTYDSTTNTGGQKVIVQFTLRASDQPFADGLALTTQAQATYTNAGGELLANAAIKQQVMQEPSLVTKTGVAGVTNDANTLKGTVTYAGDGVATTNPTAVFSDPTTTGAVFDGAIPSVIGAAENQNVSGVDGADTVRIVQTVENVGHGNAFDVVVKGTLPSGYSAADVTNLKVTRGDGQVLSFTGTMADFFATGITVKGTDGTGNTVVLKGTGDAGNADILYVTYDLKLSATQSVASTLTAAGTIVNWSGAHNSTGFVTDGSPVGGTAANLTDNATMTTSGSTFVKAITAGDNPNVTLNSVVVGETITYTFTLTLPEGRMSNVTFTDTLPSFLTNIQLGTVTFGANVTADGAATLNLAGGIITANFGNIVNANADANGTVTFTFTARIADSTNVNGTTIQNTGTLNWATSDTLSSSVTATERDPVITETLSANNGGAAVHSGQTLTYTFTVTNNGTAPSENFFDTLTLPAGLTWVASSLTTGATTGTTGITLDDTNHTISIDRLAVGGSATFTFQAIVNNDLAANTSLQVTTPGATPRCPVRSLASAPTTPPRRTPSRPACSRPLC